MSMNSSNTTEQLLKHWHYDTYWAYGAQLYSCVDRERYLELVKAFSKKYFGDTILVRIRTYMCVCVCLCMCVYVCTYVCLYVSVSVSMSVYLFVRMCVCAVSVFVCVCLYVCLSACTYVLTYICMCISVHMYVYISINIRDILYPPTVAGVIRTRRHGVYA